MCRFSTLIGYRDSQVVRPDGSVDLSTRAGCPFSPLWSESAKVCEQVSPSRWSAVGVARLSAWSPGPPPRLG
eukprot:676861-Prorocentrum_minimum.AAC.1